MKKTATVVTALTVTAALAGAYAALLAEPPLSEEATTTITPLASRWTSRSSRLAVATTRALPAPLVRRPRHRDP